MKIVYHKQFEKRYKKLPKEIKEKVKDAIITFSVNPKDLSLKNHALKGRLKGKRAISVTGNFRIIFEEKNNYVLIIILDLGTHSQVY